MSSKRPARQATLSDYPDHEGYRWGKDIISERPQISMHIGQVVSACATIENMRAQTFCLAFPSGARSAMAVYDTLKTQERKSEALKAAVAVSMSTSDREIVHKIESKAKQTFDFRNQLVHSIFGVCDRIPNAILLIPENAPRSDRILEFPGVRPMIMSVPPKKIFVYLEVELRDLEQRAWECAGFYHDLHWCFSYRAQRGERQVEQYTSRSAQALAIVSDVEKRMDETYGQIWDRLKKI